MSGELPRVVAGGALGDPLMASEVAQTDSLVESFDDFYRSTHHDVARALALTLRNVDLARDSIDEAFVRAYQRWDRLSRYENPGGWVYRVALNLARSRLRQLRRRAARQHVLTNSIEHIEHRYADPEVGAALAGLSVNHRSVVVCRLLLGWSERDTAAALDIRPGTVKSRLSRALEQLQTRLVNHPTEDS